VVHGAQRGGEALLAPAGASPDFRLRARFDRDYIFEVVPDVQRSEGSASR